MRRALAIVFSLLFCACAENGGVEWRRDAELGGRALSHGRLSEAEPALESALARAESFRPEDNRLASSLNALGDLRMAQGSPAKAEVLYRRALAIMEREFGRVLSDAAKALQPLYERKGLSFTLELPAATPAAKADPEALVMVATNLVGNAVKYTSEGGEVTAGVSVEPDGRLRVYVADTGIGIAPGDRETILSGHRTAEGRMAATGFGVGLMLVKKILDAHGAALEIEGAPGKGSRFSFVLPPWDAPADEMFLV